MASSLILPTSSYIHHHISIDVLSLFHVAIIKRLDSYSIGVAAKMVLRPAARARSSYFRGCCRRRQHVDHRDDKEIEEGDPYTDQIPRFAGKEANLQIGGSPQPSKRVRDGGDVGQ